MTPEERARIDSLLHPRYRDGIPVDDVASLTKEQIAEIFPNFTIVWRGFLRELAQQQAESESA